MSAAGIAGSSDKTSLFLSAATAPIAVAAVTAAVYILGALKTYRYFAVFGLPLAALDISTQEYLSNSWYVVECVLCLLLTFWTLLRLFRSLSQTRWRVCLLAIALLYTVLPALALQHANNRYAVHFFENDGIYFTFVPLVLIGALIIISKDGRIVVDDQTPFANNFTSLFGLIAFIVIAANCAQVIGFADGTRALRDPDHHCSIINVADNPPLSFIPRGDNVYLLHMNAKWVFLLVIPSHSSGGQTHVITISRNTLPVLSIANPPVN